MSSHLIPAEKIKKKKKHFSSPAWELRRGNKDGCNSSSGFMSQNLLPLAGGPEAALRRCRTGPPPPVCTYAAPRMSNAKCQECVRGRRRREAQTEKRNWREMWCFRRSEAVEAGVTAWVWNSQGRDRSWEPVNETYSVIRDPPSSLAGSLPASPTVGRWGPVCLYDSLIHLLLPPTYNTGSKAARQVEI